MKLRLVRCRIQIAMNHRDQVNDARADQNLADDPILYYYCAAYIVTNTTSFSRYLLVWRHSLL
jgi:hypothetical protein